MKTRHILPFLPTLVILVLLIQITAANLPTLASLPTTVLFGVLIVFTMTFAVNLGGGMVSLTSMTIMAAYLVVGPIMAAWAAFLGAIIHGFIRFSFAEEIDQPVEDGLLAQIGIAFANAGLQSLSILAAGSIYQNARGNLPLVDLQLTDLLPLAFLGLAYVSVNHLLAGAYMALHGREKFDLYVKAIPRIILFEAYTFVFAPLMALIYSRLGLAVFIIFAFAIVLTSLALNNLASARQRLERRIMELGSLQAVGNALSSSLDLQTILSAIYTQVLSLMPAENFYIALYDPQTGEISYPFEVENGEKVKSRSPQGGNELTEYILRTKRPLLIRKGGYFQREKPGAHTMEKPPVSFLGVPLVAGQESLGVIVLQSYTFPGLFDNSHKEILCTIAAQAALAIQNARLYNQTDLALANRVQELDSILRTTAEGILLLDVDWRVRAANRTVAKFLGVSPAAISGVSLGSRREDTGSGLMRTLGYSAEELREDCRELKDGNHENKKQTWTVPGTPERYLERNLTPVRDRNGEISGYLIVIRDLTEERQLAKLRDEMTHMLIHDLRSPLSTLQGVLNVISESLTDGKVEESGQLIYLAQQSGERMLHLIDDLLNINQLENERIPLNPKVIMIEELLEQVVKQIEPMVEKARITVEIDVDPDLPKIELDTEYFERVLNNLIDNAYKFTPDGGSIRIWAHKAIQFGETGVVIGVSDSGPGITEQDQSCLFKKFQQVISNKGRRTGTGLGLVYCKLAVEAHGGKIWVESEPGQGSTFLVRLPAPA
jgi:NtrC-family two-component system sensor histidine kinase KinB